MTRDAFWARLALPDRQTREEDGSVLVRSTLPHLSWTLSARLAAGGHWWAAAPLPPVVERGRLVHAYRLRLLTDPASPEAAQATPPEATAYQDEVRAQVAQQWRDVRSSGFGWLVSLLPVPVQERAVGREGGPRAIRVSTIVSIAATLVAAVWFATGLGPINTLVGILLAVDVGLRLWRLLHGEYAPSLFGGLISDYLQPERKAFHAHRDAERQALADLAGAAR
jgi:hypothetical protein